jgi:hypothetical protein
MRKIVIKVVYKHPNKLRIRVNAVKTLTLKQMDKRAIKEGYDLWIMTLQL